MPVSFNNGPNVGPTTLNDDDDSSVGTAGTTVSDQDSRVSASEYAGTVNANVPEWLMFTEAACRKQVKPYRGDAAELMRVCGNGSAQCNRAHSGVTRFGEGWYKTILGHGGRFVDGVVGTCLSQTDYEAKMAAEGVARSQGVSEAGESLSKVEDLGLKLSSSEESGYRMAKTGDERLPALPRRKNPPRGAAVPTVKDEVAWPALPKRTTPPKGVVANDPSWGSVLQARAQTGVRDKKTPDKKTPEFQGLPTETKVPAALPIKKDPKPVTDVKPPAVDVNHAMLFTMQQLTSTLANMQNEMMTLRSTVGELRHEAVARDDPAPYRATQHPPAVTPEKPSGFHAEMEGGPFYAVAKGAGGHQGIYRQWSEASQWVNNIPGNVHQKFHSFAAAQAFIENFNTEQAHRSQVGTSGNLFRASPGDSNALASVPGRGVQSNAFLYGAAEGLERPSTDFLGPDPSTKTEDEFYNVDATSESDLLKMFTPKEMETSMKRGLCNAISDVVSLPGGYQSSVAEDESGLALFTQSMAEMAHGSKGDMEIFGRPDLNWRAAGRTSLKGVTSEEKLRKRIKTLIKLGHKVRKQTSRLMINGLKKAGWADDGVINAWAQGGPIYRLVCDSLEYNMSLLQHLMGLATAGVPWSYVQTEIDHHVDEMSTIRAVADTRLQAFVQLYCYLRDGNAGSWQSTALQSQRNVELYTRDHPSTTEGTHSTGSAGGSDEGGLCHKCGTRIHGSNRKLCPWFKLPDKKAKQMAAKFLRGELGAPAGGAAADADE
jgi:hypothetical protein